MNIHEFVKTAMLNIQCAIDEFNKDNAVKASFPSKIDFELAVCPDKNELKVISAFDAVPKEITTIKFSVNPLTYSWLQKAKD